MYISNECYGIFLKEDILISVQPFKRWFYVYTTFFGHIVYFTYLSRASLEAGDSGTTKRTCIGSVSLCELEFEGVFPSLEPPTMENPQLAFSLLWRITVFGYCRLRGSFCQYIQLGIKLDAPNDVSGPSITPKIT